MKVNEMNDSQLIFAAQAMASFGGEFVRQIARAFYAADNSNRARLVAAFPELFEKFGPGSMYFEHVMARESEVA